VKRLLTEKSRTISGSVAAKQSRNVLNVMPLTGDNGHPSLGGAAADLRDCIVIDSYSDKDIVWRLLLHYPDVRAL